MKKRYLLLLLLVLLVLLTACGGTQEPYYLPASEVLMQGDILYCPSVMEITITQNEKETIKGKATCVKNQVNDAEDYVTFYVNSASLNEINMLVGLHRQWGVVTNNNGDLLQIYDQSSNGVHIMWETE